MHEGLEAFLAATALEHVAQLRREIRALAQQRVAADTVVLLPDRLATYHGVAQLRGIAAFGKGLLGVIGQGQEYQEEEHASPEIDVPGHALGEGL
ncbi:hypothetical protein D3C76_1544790 [compost metagenome]